MYVLILNIERLIFDFVGEMFLVPVLFQFVCSSENYMNTSTPSSSTAINPDQDICAFETDVVSFYLFIFIFSIVSYCRSVLVYRGGVTEGLFFFRDHLVCFFSFSILLKLNSLQKEMRNLVSELIILEDKVLAVRNARIFEPHASATTSIHTRCAF